MKILYIITKSEVGGAQTHVADLCRYFSNKGNKVAVMSYPGGWLETEVAKYGVKFFGNKFFSNSLNPLKLVKAFSEVAKIVRDFKPDLVACHSSAAGIITRLVVRNQIPTVFTAHGWSFNLGVPVWQKVLGLLGEKVASRFCVKIIAICEFVKDFGVSNNVASFKKFQVIYNGVNVVDEDRSGSDSQYLRLIFVGRLAEPKQPLILLKAIKALPSHLQKDIILDIYGNGPQKLLLQNFINQNHLEQVEIISGFNRDQIIKKMQLADVLAMPTRYEGLPYVILEAMSCGMAVVSSRVGGIAEAVDVQTGWLVGDNTVNDWKEVLEKILNDKHLILEKSKAAREKIKNNFSLEKMCSETEKIYNDLLIQ